MLPIWTMSHHQSDLTSQISVIPGVIPDNTLTALAQGGGFLFQITS